MHYRTVRPATNGDSPMSKELDAKIDALRAKLIQTANTPVSMGNYKQIRRAYEEVILDLTNAVDEINAEGDK
jgi:Zn-dependent M16 (insulinase) family peptidase